MKGKGFDSLGGYSIDFAFLDPAIGEEDVIPVPAGGERWDLFGSEWEVLFTNG